MCLFDSARTEIYREKNAYKADGEKKPDKSKKRIWSFFLCFRPKNKYNFDIAELQVEAMFAEA